jgi:hypothetical protein
MFKRLITVAMVFVGAAAAFAQEREFRPLAGAWPSGNADDAGGVARFSAPRGITVDNAGSVYVADTNNHTIRTITPAGVVTTLAGMAGSTGSADGTGSAARFRQPRGLAIDSAGTVYVADANNHTIRSVAADGTGSAAQFTSPRAVAVDSAGMVSVTDGGNNRVRQVTAAGVVTTLAGGGIQGGLDGTGSDARFNVPEASRWTAPGSCTSPTAPPISTTMAATTWSRTSRASGCGGI